ncbi:SOS response-associated peptidase family protein [Burkholderia multivorans]|uniref:SOS response-associated peptidase family protein n=1 Tax=Burkholderia multivorans TaxID=87883 RepID=UPI0037098C27
MCVAGISQTLQGQDGTEHHTMSIITVNGEGHPVFSRMHKPEEEKRAVVMLRPDDWEEWLTTSNTEAVVAAALSS